MTQLETLIGDFCRVVSEYLLFAEEWERTGETEIYLLPLDYSAEVRSSPEDGAKKRSNAEWVAIAATSVDELGKQLTRCLESRGIETKELRRFLRAVRLWQPSEASSLWDDLELDLEGIALRLRHERGTKPGTHITHEPPANGANPIAAEFPDSPKQIPGKGRPQAETDQLVAEYLNKYPDAKIAEIVKETGCSQGSVQKSPAWQELQQRRKASRTAAKSKPRFHQLRNEGEASILADTREPVDALIAAEDASDDLLWCRLIDAATPEQRAFLYGCNEEIRTQLIQLRRKGHTDEEAKAVIALAATQNNPDSDLDSDTDPSKRRGKRRSRKCS